MKIQDGFTVIAVAAAAFALADFAHEGIGHGGACLALGGKVQWLSSTYEACSIRSRIIDGAGPVAGIVAALLAFLVLRARPPTSAATRAFLCLTFAFAAFWNIGYLIKSGIADTGDWAFVIAGLEPTLAWRVGLVVLGVVLYAATMRLLGALLRSHLVSHDTAPTGQSPLAFAVLAFATAITVACAAALFDPRGVQTVWNDAAPSALAAFGLVWVAYRMTRPTTRIAIAPSPAWIASGAAAAIVLIGVLGPGVRA